MAQKDKIKELVGRSLNSYHTKSLQQIDRIEKKNKEQNHKISILSNELDNDYLTKTEEGSVVSLEHSKEGMVYLDELQGNTLVNYCTDGSKEMTLNGDIDVEGTFVTTTEGVDNGKVDIVCEGNTLVNLKYGQSGNNCTVSCSNNTNNQYFILEENSRLHCKGEVVETARNLGLSWVYYPMGNIRTNLLKPNTTYTVILDNKVDSITGIYLQHGNSSNAVHKSIKKITKDIFTITTKDSFEGITINDNSTILYGNMSWDYKGKVDYRIIAFLEGDWSEKEIPNSFFEGMQSVGQDDANGHKIEILSQNYQELNTDTNGLVCHLKAGTSAIINNIMSDLSGNGNNATLYGASINGNYLNFNGESDYATINRCVSDDFTISLKAEVISAKGGSLGNDSHWYNYAGLVDGEYPSVVNDFGLTITNEGYPCLGIGKPDTTVRHKETCFNKLTTFTYTRNKTTGEMKLYIDGKHSATISSTNKNSLNDNPLLFIGRSANKTAYAKMKFYELKIYNKVLNESEIFKFNKKEILINEPLVGNDTIKDKVVKIGGKYFIERLWRTVILDGTQELIKGGWAVPIFSYYVPNTEGEPTNFPNTLICDRITPKSFNLNDDTHWALYTGKDSVESQRYIRMQIPASIISKDDLEGFKTWLRNNPVTIAYRLNAPIYEPLEIEPTLSCYTDVTHISNNSLIPCNMKIKNSGYNAIIKPSTQYTVALDTNKNGTIGMNLGGAKVTTTNNVATITTPATLTDDSLRLYGKGIKGSKVRLLEGDKTNWIPSFFEGMKSSFEDKPQEDGSYKMEILSNNKNLFNINWTKRNSGDGVTYKISNNNIIVDVTDKADAWAGCYMPLVQLQPNTEYSIRCDRINGFGAYIIGIKDSSGSNVADFKEGMEYKSFVTPSNGIVQLRFFSHNTQQNSSYQTIFKNIVLCKGNKIVDYTEPKSNKIQFSSIEPLRSVNLRNRYVKDRFVFKDDKLVIERNCKKIVLDGTQSFSKNADQSKDGTSLFGTGDLTPERPSYHVECDSFGSSGNNLMTNTTFANIEGIGCWSAKKNFNIRIKTCRLKEDSGNGMMEYVRENPITIIYPTSEPTYEELPHELQKIILEGYENGTLFFDTNIPPTSTVTYAGETPIVKATRLNKTEVLNNTEDINDNIIPYLMDMDYRVVCLQLQSENINDGVSMARLFGGAYEMLQRDIQSKRYSVDEYRHRLDAYLDANKITEEEYNKLGDMLNE